MTGRAIYAVSGGFDAAWREADGLKGGSFLLELSIDADLAPPEAARAALTRMVAALDHTILDERTGAAFSLPALARWIAVEAGLPALRAVRLSRPGLQDAVSLTL
jgi:hypothetical protein